MIAPRLAAPTLALIALFASGASAAADCAVTVDSTDQMTFSTHSLAVPKSCKTFSVTLTHSGSLPKNVMGHNLVISTASDQPSVVSDGMASGLANDYLKVGDSRVIAHTKVLGAGESDTLTLDVAALKEGESYQFYCTVPGHISMMLGDVKRVD